MTAEARALCTHLCVATTAPQPELATATPSRHPTSDASPVLPQQRPQVPTLTVVVTPVAQWVAAVVVVVVVVVAVVVARHL